MIKVAFLLQVSESWMGGLNYMKNLLYAIHTSENKEIEPLIFVPKGKGREISKDFEQYGRIIEVPFLKKRTISWFLWKISRKLTNSDFMVEVFLSKYKIKVYSHSGLIGLKNSKTINWIPDFQHIHLPNMFSEKEFKARNKLYYKISKNSNVVVLSSKDALQDYNKFNNNKLENGRVLQFVSQPGNYSETTKSEFEEILHKYKLPENFFFLPNQFWKHKNHITAFKALKLLKDKGINATIVCTGHLQDYRNKEHIETLLSYIEDNNIDVRLLGLIDYNDLILLMKYSIAVINPSLFEGWSSTVEECKSLGKNIILSNIPVHYEQSPEYSFYFNPLNENELASILEYHIINRDTIINNYNKEDFINNLKKRTNTYSLNYFSIINKL